jgi:hypothetical protein
MSRFADTIDSPRIDCLIQLNLSHYILARKFLQFCRPDAVTFENSENFLSFLFSVLDFSKITVSLDLTDGTPTADGSDAITVIKS